MSENRILIKPIYELIGSGYNFNIPSYQRGYRWTEQQVTDLLEDINEFLPGGDAWYCLQPVVVKNITKKSTDFRVNLIKEIQNLDEENILNKVKELINQVESPKDWEVIDGQQRLTTIFLILKYLKIKGLYSLYYDTRPDLQSFLLKDFNDIEGSNIDLYFVKNAYNTIEKWFKDKDADFNANFTSKFLKSTKVIWYEIATNDDSIDIFTRLNSGKIPLTNAELIKALFLNSSNFKKEVDSEKIRLKQLEIASEWDRIENSLQDDSFWFFINKSDSNLETRIEFIFNLIYELEILNNPDEKYGYDEYSTFRFFAVKIKIKSGNEINENWKQIKKYFQTLEEWFNDRELYHKIGYLISVGINIVDILIQKKSKNKNEFLNYLNDIIREKFKDVKIEELVYNGNNVREVLLLHNIQSMLKNKNETSRFPFDRFKKEFWDVEHIHAIATEIKVNKNERLEWITVNYVDKEKELDFNINNESKKIIENIRNNQDVKDEDFEKVINFVLGEEDNSIRNLCLLDRGTNRSYKNDSFKLKRSKLIEREKEGIFIPMCTKNVFMKYYSNVVKDIEIWNESDREDYLENIKQTIYSLINSN